MHPIDLLMTFIAASAAFVAGMDSVPHGLGGRCSALGQIVVSVAEGLEREP
jgi:hypothetical protein